MVRVTTLPVATRFSARGDDVAVDAIGRAFGVALPREVCRAATGGDRAALWLGPDEWLLIAPDGEARRLMAAMNAALGQEPASLVEISDRQVAIEISGEEAAEAINAFNALDLDVENFPVGMCTRTLFGKAEIVLWRTAPETFRVEVWRSFAPYVEGCLGEATREYGAA
jgi:sarcosine oxidase, subunit gamma